MLGWIYEYFGHLKKNHQSEQNRSQSGLNRGSFIIALAQMHSMTTTFKLHKLFSHFYTIVGKAVFTG